MVRVFLFLSVPMALVLAIGAPTLLPFIFGDRYAASTSVLQVMAWTSVLGFQNYVLWYGVLATHKERAALGVQLVGLVVNVALNLVASPLYGATGAALALVISDLVVVVGQTMIVHRHLFRVPWMQVLARPTVTALVVLPLTVLLASESALGAAVAGAACYCAMLLALRYVTLAEWAPVMETMRAPFVRLARRLVAST